MAQASALLTRAKSLDDELIELLAACENKPLDFALTFFTWGEPGTELEDHHLETWQIGLLTDLQSNILTFETAIKIAIKAGHDTGKSALICIIILWAFSTRAGTRGRITANTEKQLRTVLWAELNKWFNLFLAKQFFSMTATALTSADPSVSATWRIDAMPWSSENPAAFAGLHNFGNRLIIIFDEAPKIPDIIYEVVDGTMREANTQLFWIVAGQPLLNHGRFYACWNEQADNWLGYTIDSREVRMGNQAAIAADIKAYGGEDTDLTRVRIRGEFPTSDIFQFFPKPLILAAQTAQAVSQPWEPLIMGVDIARRGGDNCAVVFRRGRDARTLLNKLWKPVSDIDPTGETGGILAGMINVHQPDAVFLDATGYGGGVADFLRRLGHSVVGVDFGSGASSAPGGVAVLNKRSEMFVLLKEWMGSGGCIRADLALESELLSIQYGYGESESKRSGELRLTPKEHMKTLGFDSPDWADALALTFAYPVSFALSKGMAPLHKVDYEPISFEALNPTPPRPALNMDEGWNMLARFKERQHG